MQNKTTRQQRVQQAIEHYDTAKKEHTKVVTEMENIVASITSCREQNRLPRRKVSRMIPAGASCSERHVV
ncbi:hypothetical protein ACSPAH_16855 [Buttiauxella agrestis]